MQMPLKKPLSEMLEIHDRAAEKLFKMRGVTAVAILANKLAVGTSNTTDAEGRRPDPAAVEGIERAFREIDQPWKSGCSTASKHSRRQGWEAVAQLTLLPLPRGRSSLATLSTHASCTC